MKNQLVKLLLICGIIGLLVLPGSSSAIPIPTPFTINLYETADNSPPSGNPASGEVEIGPTLGIISLTGNQSVSLTAGDLRLTDSNGSISDVLDFPVDGIGAGLALHFTLYSDPASAALTLQTNQVSMVEFGSPPTIYTPTSGQPGFETTGTYAITYNIFSDSRLDPPHSDVPEPTTMLLLGSGLLGLAWYGRKKYRK